MSNKKNEDDDVDMGSIKKKGDIKEIDEEAKWWDEYINANAKGKGKGKGKGFQGSCYNCGEYGHSIRNCPKEPSQNKGGKEYGGKGSPGSKG